MQIASAEYFNILFKLRVTVLCKSHNRMLRRLRYFIFIHKYDDFLKTFILILINTE
jgi:hypothetical protein